MELTAAEYRLLCFLLKNSGKVLTRGMILDRLWDGAGNFVDDNTLSVYVRRLREKLEKETMQSLERMEQLIQSLLKMARLDTGNIVSEKRQCFVAEVAEQAVSELLERARQEEKRILISWKSFHII